MINPLVSLQELHRDLFDDGGNFRYVAMASRFVRRWFACLPSLFLITCYFTIRTRL
jgi:hypothetical protein